MNTLAHANGHSQPMPRAADPQDHPLPAPRFTIEPADLPSPSQERETRNPELAAASPPNADTPPSDKKPPPAKKRRFNSFRDSQERVSDMKKLLPRKVPRRRDLHIYDYVVFEKMSQHMVAEIFGITQARVCQIVREIRAWKSTVPYDIPGMTDEQQINLATHETRQWLDRIRDKCLEKVDMTSCGETRTYIDENQNKTKRTISEHSVSPKPGFMSVALAAVTRSGKLAGAGEQWMRNRVQNPKSMVQSPDEGMTNGRSQMTNDQAPMTNEIPNPKSEIPNQPPAASPQSTICNPQSPAPCPESLAPSSNGRLLKEKTPAFSPQNGKPNGHKTSAFRSQAQVERARRRKKRETTYQAAAEREKIGVASQPPFFRLLRELDRIADRVEDRVEAETRRDRVSRTPTERQSLIHSLRLRYLERFLQISSRILTPPYDWQWVCDRYSADTGRFRWAETDGTGPGG